MKINPPDFKAKNYERYRLELEAWREITDLKKGKQGIAIALSLPEDDESGIREKVFDELAISDLKADTGLDTLLTFLDNKLQKDDLADSWDKFNDFEEYKREKGQSISDYISKFDQKYKKIVRKKMTLPSEILAFKLLKRATLNPEEHMLVLTGMDYSTKETLYDQAIRSLKKFKGDQVVESTKADGAAIKLDAAYLAENEDVLMAAGYVYRGRLGDSGRGRGRSFYSRGRTMSRGRYTTQVGAYHRGNSLNHSYKQPERRINSKDASGKVLTCISCGSYRHLLAECPDSWENLSAKTYAVEDDSAKVVLFTGKIKEDIQQLGDEARNCAVLDCACSSTVCGETWLQCYLQSLDAESKAKVKQYPGVKIFKFGGGEKLASIASYDLPAFLAEKEVIIHTDVVESDIPLLLSLQAMKKAKIKLDLEKDSAEIFGQNIMLNHTSSGHYCIPIDKGEISLENVCTVKLWELDDKERYKTLLKLHRQFAHPPERKLVTLLKDANIWEDTYRQDLKTIHEKCELCKIYAKTPARPAVSLPMASRFNEKVAMDLKSWGNRWILHLIDMWSRLTVSIFIDRKKPSVIIDNIMLHWVGTGFGIMQSILSDNGGEFNADEIREVSSILNVEVCTTAAYSPFQNGLCERVHSVTDMMLLKLKEQCPNTPLNVLLAWANTARNSLQMWHGFSSYQLVFGQNPNLPNVMTDHMPALEGTTTSEMLTTHLNALHTARKAFIESESNERIRRALRSKVRASEQTFSNGDRVYYKREGLDRWLGPGKVVFQDGKVVFVRHGGVFVRVSPNRLIKTGEEIDTTTQHNKNTKMFQSRGNEFEIPEQTPTKKANMYELVGPAIDDLAIPANKKPVPQIPLNQEGNGQLTQSLPKKNDVILIKKTPSCDWSPVKVIGRAGKTTGIHKSWINIRSSDGGDGTCINLQEIEWKHNDTPIDEVNIVIIPKEDHNNDECIAAKHEEIRKLKEFKTYEEVPDTGQYKISTTWVIWNKGDTIRARLVARGYEEISDIRKDSPTVSKGGLRTFLVVAANRKWRIKTTDIKSAFLQGKPLSREVFIQPPREVKVRDTIWKLNRCLYGLNDAARQFYESVREVLMQLKCNQSGLDPAIFYYKQDGVTCGVLACHVDDFLHAGDADFELRIIGSLRKRFIAGKFEETAFSYIGFHVSQDDNGISLDQNDYINNLETTTISSERMLQKQDALSTEEHTNLRTIVGRLNWAVQGTRPDLAFDMIELSTKFKKGTVNDLLRAIKCIRKLKESCSNIIFPTLGSINSWRIIVFSDAAHANLSDGVSSMGGHIVFLVGAYNSCCVLSWQANKIKRIVRSTLAAEALSLQEGLESGFYHRILLQEILSVNSDSIPIDAFVDNKSVVEAVHSTKLVDDKRLRIDISAIKESVMKSEVRSIRWCPGSLQLANCLTKRGAQSHQLLQILHSGKLYLDGWEIRD